MWHAWTKEQTVQMGRNTKSKGPWVLSLTWVYTEYIKLISPSNTFAVGKPQCVLGTELGIYHVKTSFKLGVLALILHMKFHASRSFSSWQATTIILYLKQQRNNSLEGIIFFYKIKMYTC